MNKVSKLLCILVLVFSFFIFACGEEETNDKENLGFSLPTEESILNKLGENCYFKIVEKIEGFETVKEYYSTKEGYFVSITEDDVNTSYLYLKGVNEFYLGDNKKLTLKDNDDLYESSYGMDYIGFFEGDKVEKESDLEITVNGRECKKYIIKGYSCYIDNELGACIRCLDSSSGYEWSVKDLKIGGISIQEFIALTK